jgi:hypothetical protein
MATITIGTPVQVLHPIRSQGLWGYGFVDKRNTVEGVPGFHVRNGQRGFNVKVTDVQPVVVPDAVRANILADNPGADEQWIVAEFVTAMREDLTSHRMDCKCVVCR